MTQIITDKLVVILLSCFLIFLYIPHDWNVSLKLTVLNLVVQHKWNDRLGKSSLFFKILVIELQHQRYMQVLLVFSFIFCSETDNLHIRTFKVTQEKSPSLWNFIWRSDVSLSFINLWHWTFFQLPTIDVNPVLTDCWWSCSFPFFGGV